MATTEPASPPSVRRELTVRALAAGCALGALLAAGNVYTALKTGFIDGMSIPAALLAFMIFSGARRFGGGPFGVLENNITQTTASSAAIMGFGLIMQRRSIGGSLIGGLPETQEMLDFCAKHEIMSDVEVIPMQKINDAYGRMLKGDVKYRFVIDLASLR